MTFRIRAIDRLGLAAIVATEDAREALQSLLAFEVAKFQDVTVLDEAGQELMVSDLLEITQSVRPATQTPVPDRANPNRRSSIV